MSFALYERREAVGLVTLDRPDRLNAISGDLMRDFVAALEAAFDDAGTGAIVLTGNGRAFCSGDDLKEFDLQTESDEAVRDHVAAIQSVTRLLMGRDKPVVGAIHGYAVGGGFEWLLNCDLVVASDDLVAFFPEMDWGHFVTGGVTHLLPLTVGYQRAMELLLLGERQSAARLEALGIVNRVVPRDEMLACALDLAARIAAKSRFATAKLKSTLNGALGDALWRAVDHEETVTVEAFSHPDTIERVKGFEARRKR
ncbi:enoyl-CoA hydratase/isomerase family protein [Aureimonas flava]|uniref:Enoyl-CoA hydratase/isomerase family protein n=1 Tax=Aureimonas flava TaxID=2320271 RepID=A0A3A1WPW1_9HYPH|nr:enoyl-CoA hydratase/isomerase family protein [Aureimonas flava]RIY02802.1 enoyl-CoA hydratase/isomerase family protein [Aureimonas flava]